MKTKTKSEYYYVKKGDIWVLNKIPKNMIATGIIRNIFGQILTSKGMKIIWFQKVTKYKQKA